MTEIQEDGFVKHIAGDGGWSEWVCPKPKGYLMKCCDCGLVHEMEFQVVKYPPGSQGECEVVGDPDIQASFRARRDEP